MLHHPKPWTKCEVERQRWAAGAGRTVSASATMIHLLRRGRVSFGNMKESNSARAGQLVWIPSGMHVIRNVETDASAWTIRLRVGLWAPHADGDREAVGLIRMLDWCAAESGLVMPITAATSRRLAELLQRLAGIWRYPQTTFHRCALKGGAMELLTILARDKRIRELGQHAQTDLRRTAVERVSPALNLLNQRNHICQTKVTVETLAARCGYRPSRFHAYFVQATGTTPIRYLIERRIAIACDLLSRPNLRVLDVALQCGFASQSRFYAAFKSITGMTPSQWRKPQAL